MIWVGEANPGKSCLSKIANKFWNKNALFFAIIENFHKISDAL
jgi:hypothetical protein